MFPLETSKLLWEGQVWIVGREKCCGSWSLAGAAAPQHRWRKIEIAS